MRTCTLAFVLALAFGWTANTATAGGLHLCAKADLRGPDATAPKAKSAIKLREECRSTKEVSLGTTEDLQQIQPLVDRVAALEQQPLDLTQGSVEDVLAAIHNADILTDAQVGIIEAFLEYSQPLLSPEALGVQEALIAEMDEAGILPHELDTRSDELTVPQTHPDWALYEQEAQEIYSSLAAKRDQSRMPWFIPLGVIAGLVACDVKIQACAEDVNQQYGDCWDGRLCNANQTVDRDCCAAKWKSDWKNCATTCGLNGPDGDYANCCEENPPTPTPPTPTPAPPTATVSYAR